MVIGSLAISPISGPREAHDEQLLGPGGPATVFLLDLPKELGQLIERAAAHLHGMLDALRTQAAR